MLSFFPFPLDVLDEIWNVIESVSEGFLTYFCLNDENSVALKFLILIGIYSLAKILPKHS